ncbi:MAG TPA: hypothetical protein VNZ48_00360 [Xanthobacteraceae bacterium]|jgi:D-alanine-D-alanine ligase|nr:hypothetical protein [Xanthobacteraceae bacterium]
MAGAHGPTGVPPIILLTERRPRAIWPDPTAGRDLDMTTVEQADAIVGFLRLVSTEVEEINSLDLFQARVSMFRKCVVLPHWSGANSRNRHTFASSLCEIHGVPYLGADSYARVVTNDKWLSKTFLTKCDFLTPPSVLIRNRDDLQGLKNLRCPLIVKPNNENSSIGIDQRSIALTLVGAEELADRLLNAFPDGVIVEQYIRGREVTISAVFYEGEILDVRGGERYLVDDEDYLIDHVYDSNLKFSSSARLGLRPLPPISLDTRGRILRLARMIGGLDYVRLDCREQDGLLHAFEITVDPLLVPEAAFLGNFTAAGQDPVLLFRKLVLAKVS